ncbi:alpha-1,6-mannosyl-glycoprotein 2-beta-N-acetylglucosaminyltransferase isoform X2 [Ziziphus jujuba]|uniref:Alpha-1,6-mannosyl-glycoprotein 2-beta-N-acetylglucosaminyltransferase n=1 Tax=Ziziphus jujuba TaxID=326968 RepID=A0A6P4AUG2_ZIZJJ|nr:alpha-1,6-mannosyl-glycoprotein 2-beta-N-acetylglucosaminyltransferase isoform X2 [Ziziphus jujuba]
MGQSQFGDCAMASNKKPRLKDKPALRRFLLVVSITLLGVFLLIIHMGKDSRSKSSFELDEDSSYKFNYSQFGEELNLPKQNTLSIELEKRNQMPPRNRDLYPRLAKDHTTIVLYVHNRPRYLKVVVESLSRVVGISETLLIVSHDGYFEEMNEIIESIRFCQVKQIFAPYSPHVFLDSFPGVSPKDCKDKDDAEKKHCNGTPDQYGNHRSPKIVSLKHHWWWMMNTVWDGLQETREDSNHILFIEEDHFIYPNAYRNLQMLTALKPKKCPDCYAANLAPCDVNSRGEGWDSLVAERMGNVGYAFNRTVWRKIHKKAREFCFFDDYNWDITMWATVYPSFGGPVYSLRGPRTSAVHFGKCGLHQGQGVKNACIDNGGVKIEVDKIDKVVNIKPEWEVRVFENQPGYKAGFKGWGGWGDERDRQLCLNFARMYHLEDTASM